MQSNHTKVIALGGVLAAVAIVIMCLGGLIPGATYICPVLCTLLGNMIQKLCGRRHAWEWYSAVSLLSILLTPDKEAAIVYILLGYYPYIKPYFDKFKFRIIFKFLYFNFITIIAYLFMLWVFGQIQILDESAILGTMGILIVLILANVTFLCLIFCSLENSRQDRYKGE